MVSVKIITGWCASLELWSSFQAHLYGKCHQSSWGETKTRNISPGGTTMYIDNFGQSFNSHGWFKISVKYLLLI